MREVPLTKQTTTNNPTLWVFVKDNYCVDLARLNKENEDE